MFLLLHKMKIVNLLHFFMIILKDGLKVLTTTVKLVKIEKNKKKSFVKFWWKCFRVIYTEIIDLAF